MPFEQVEVQASATKSMGSITLVIKSLMLVKSKKNNTVR